MKKLNVATRRGSVLNVALFDTPGADTVLVNITGIHGNFYSNPFYYDFGAALNSGGFDFVCQNELAILSVIQLYSAPAVTAIPKAVVMPAAIRCFIVIIV